MLLRRPAGVSNASRGDGVGAGAQEGLSALGARMEQLLRESSEQRMLLAAQQRTIEAQGRRLERLLSMLGGGGTESDTITPGMRRAARPGSGRGSATSDDLESSCEL